MGFVQFSEKTAEWVALAERLGVWAIAAIMLGLFVWKVLWPFVADQVNKSREQAERTLELTQKQLEVSHTARERALTEFMGALERRDNELGKITVSVNSVAKTLEDLAELVEERKRRRS